MSYLVSQSTWEAYTNDWEDESTYWEATEETFENVVKDRIIDSLMALMKSELSIGVYFDLTFQNRSSRYFNLTLNSDELVSLLSSGQVRQYEIEIRYYVQIGGEYYKNTHFEEISKTVERFKRVFAPDNYANYSPSGTYKWHDGQITSIDYQPSRDTEEEDSDLQIASITFQCNSMEVS